MVYTEHGGPKQLMDPLSSEHWSSAQLFPQMFSLWFMLQQDSLGSSFSLASPAESSAVSFKINDMIAPSYSCKVVTGEGRRESGISQKKRPKNISLNEFESLKEPAGSHPGEGSQEHV